MADDIRVALQPVGNERAGDAAVEVTLTNAGTAPTLLDLSHAHIPSLVLEIRDADGKPVLMPPPPVPKAEDQQSAPVTLAPGQSHRIVVAIPPGVHRAPGRHDVRFRHRKQVARDPLRAADAVSAPLVSEWVPAMLAGPSSPRGLDATAVQDGPAVPQKTSRFLLRCFIRCMRRMMGRPCDKVASVEVDRQITETISDAPPPNEAWNGTYGWDTRFQLKLDQTLCRFTVQVRIRVTGAIAPAQLAAWKSALEAKWNNVFKLCCKEGCCTYCCPQGYTIACDVRFVDSGEHQVVVVGPSTTNMGNWSATDTIDITHEFGHMLGNKEEYFTIDGTPFGPGRQANGNVMNNPANQAVARHFDLIGAQAQALIDAAATCTVKAVGESC
jgi:hypothetical protein